jgi:hypothetical protein
MKRANFWISILAMTASLATVCVIVMPPRFALKGLAWVALALAAAGLSVALVVRRSPRSLGDVLQGVDAERLPAVAGTGRTNLASKGREIP